MEPSVISRVQAVLKATPVAWQEACARGCTANKRWVVQLNNGQSAFVKEAVNTRTADWLCQEYYIYARISGSFMPRLLGWCEDGEWPLLIIEDLHTAHWPPPWSPQNIKAVLKALEELASLPVTAELRASLPLLEEDLKRWPGWHNVATDPEPFLKLGLCSAAWLEKHLSILMEAAKTAPLEGNSLLHMDLRSDNLCLRDSQALFVDWNWVRIGNPLLDVIGWLPSLSMEGGPPPEEIMSEGAAGFVALLSGYWAYQAGLPPVPGAPRVRPLQFQQLRAAFPWAIRALGLSMPEELIVSHL